MAQWQNRITGHADVAPVDLVPNSRNWRTHPAEQQRAMGGALAEWAGSPESWSTRQPATSSMGICGSSSP
jgi:hypothetical protein